MGVINYLPQKSGGGAGEITNYHEINFSSIFNDGNDVLYTFISSTGKIFVSSNKNKGIYFIDPNISTALNTISEYGACSIFFEDDYGNIFVSTLPDSNPSYTYMIKSNNTIVHISSLCMQYFTIIGGHLFIANGGSLNSGMLFEFNYNLDTVVRREPTILLFRRGIKSDLYPNNVFFMGCSANIGTITTLGAVYDVSTDTFSYINITDIINIPSGTTNYYSSGSLVGGRFIVYFKSSFSSYTNYIIEVNLSTATATYIATVSAPSGITCFHYDSTYNLYIGARNSLYLIDTVNTRTELAYNSSWNFSRLVYDDNSGNMFFCGNSGGTGLYLVKTSNGTISVTQKSSRGYNYNYYDNGDVIYLSAPDWNYSYTYTKSTDRFVTVFGGVTNGIYYKLNNGDIIQVREDFVPAPSSVYIYTNDTSYVNINIPVSGYTFDYEDDNYIYLTPKNVYNNVIKISKANNTISYLPLKSVNIFGRGFIIFSNFTSSNIFDDDVIYGKPYSVSDYADFSNFSVVISGQNKLLAVRYKNEI